MEFKFDEQFDTVAKMKVIGIGGAGGNAVNRMIAEGLSGVEFLSVNTDAMALDNNRATKRIQIGERITKGLGAGANPEIGRIAMEEDRDRIAGEVEGADMVFITAGMGGGTGTGGAPVIAEITREMDILTVAIVTRPFLFEGKIRDKNARKGIDDLRNSVDTIIVIPNQKLLSIVDRNTSLIDAFKTADQVLHNATKGISDLISKHGLVNVDFADVKTIMKGMGDAIMGSGIAEGDNRAVIAADSAIHSPMLDDITISGAKGILVNVYGGEDLTLYDVGEAIQTIYDAVGENVDTNIIFGAVNDPEMNGKVQITVIATGFNEEFVSMATRLEKKASAPIQVAKRVLFKEKEAEQVSIEFDNTKKEESPKMKVLEKPEMRETKTIETVQDPKSENTVQEITVMAIPEPAKESKPLPIAEVAKEEAEENGNPLDIPVIKTGVIQPKEQKIFVSKGQVISHYEDDMDIPTFLRKQMQ